MAGKFLRKLSRFQRHLDWRGTRFSFPGNWFSTEAGRKVVISAGMLAIVLVVQQTDLAVARKIEDSIRYVITARFDYAPVMQRLESLGNLKDRLKWPFSASGEEETGDPLLPGLVTAEVEAVVRERGIKIPVQGELTSGYGYRIHPVDKVERLHTGVDIAAAEGTPIGAALAGIVVEVSEDESLGKMVRILHGDGIETLYGHCAATLVRADQFVQQGETIATVGATGVADGTHLHFEVRVDGTAIDPARIADF